MRKIPINVSKKILADVSSGIYRTPANALKEIVSNAFDADAHRVHISTNAPYFDIFTCEDDGTGISAREFEEVMDRIGSSAKREQGNISTETDRPIIGKIGIGLLAVAQICRKFSFISKKKGTKKYFHATIDLKQFEEVESEKSYKSGKGDITLGNCDIEDDLEDEVGAPRHYTKIIMEEIKEAFRQKLLEEAKERLFGAKDLNTPAKTSDYFIQFINAVKSKKFNEISQYDLLIWELGLLCPIEYIDIDDGPLPDNKVLQKEISRLKSYDFKVFVDGLEIRKPILFPTATDLKKKGIDYKIYPPIYFNKVINDSKLKFTGYMFNQRKRIQPAELQGVLIRIKGVGIGAYDRSFLRYPKSEGPMFSQLSGELFVEQGLEEALNIDRNSFNETHKHYLKVQEVLWEYLGDSKKGVFTDIRYRSKQRRDSEKKELASAELEGMLSSIREIIGIDIKLARSHSKDKGPYTFNKTERRLVFYQDPFWTRNQKEKLAREKIIIALSAAKIVSKTVNEFEENILKILACGK
jgi:hypothetical protein